MKPTKATLDSRKLNVLERAFQDAYEAIGADLQTARETCGDGGVISREELFECILDMDCLRRYGTWDEESKKVVNEFLALTSDGQRAYMKHILPYETYE